MNIIHISARHVSDLPCVATIGFFDGVHRGHQFLLHHVVDEAKKCGLKSMVITFESHPRKVLHQDYQPEMLSTLDEKLNLLASLGVDTCGLLRFDQQTACMSAFYFMEKVLRDQLHVRKLYIGYDNRFGHNREEGFHDYVKYGKQLGIEVINTSVFQLQQVNVSSTVIRKMLYEGKVEEAHACLGYPYSLTGEVVRGFQEGRRLGFPTANIDLSASEKLIPANGAYAVLVRIEGDDRVYRGMMDIGNRPTFCGIKRSYEVNIFDFMGDIYGKRVSVSFMHFIRTEQKFESVDALKAQLENDKRVVNDKLDKD